MSRPFRLSQQHAWRGCGGARSRGATTALRLVVCVACGLPLAVPSARSEDIIKAPAYPGTGMQGRERAGSELLAHRAAFSRSVGCLEVGIIPPSWTWTRAGSGSVGQRADATTPPAQRNKHDPGPADTQGHAQPVPLTPLPETTHRSHKVPRPEYGRGTPGGALRRRASGAARRQRPHGPRRRQTSRIALVPRQGNLASAHT